MFTNKAVAELRQWVDAIQDGNGSAAKEHLETFRHLGASLLASNGFQQRCVERYWIRPGRCRLRLQVSRRDRRH